MPASALELLPPDLAARSLSRRDIVLARADADAAIAHLAAAGRRIESWEGWVRMPTGSMTRSIVHSGTFALPMDVAKAAEQAAAGIAAAQARWDARPEYEGAELWYGLTVAAA